MKDKIQDLMNDCKEMENQGYTEQAKPDRFNDPIAKTTPWTPMIRGGSRSRTHRFHQDKDGNIQFKLALDVVVEHCIPLFIALFAFLSGKTWLLVITILMGILFLFQLKGMNKPITFDLENGVYTKEWETCRIEDIHAIQIIEEHTGDDPSYLSYELNLVTKESIRYNVVDHGRKTSIFRDAEKLAKVLNVPIWDGTTQE